MMQSAAGIELSKQVFNVSPAGFNSLAMDIFRFQYGHCDIYRQYCDAIHITDNDVQHIHDIPFLPIRFFKTKKITSTSFDAAVIFESSGTTGSVNSRHYVKDISMYEQSFLNAFSMFYGDLHNRCIIGLLPSYLERKNASLVWMVNEWIQRSQHPNSGFYLYDHEKLKNILSENEAAEQPTLLIGVTYALLDFAERFPMPLEYTTVMETGGMKGRREELTRMEVHEILCRQFHLPAVHSEYGMTELLSQGYSFGAGIFRSPPWMKLMIRAEDDPFRVTAATGITGTHVGGAVNIIDLANLYSCSFIATDDTGKLYPDERFEITGRLDESDARGCGLMLLNIQ